MSCPSCNNIPVGWECDACGEVRYDATHSVGTPIADAIDCRRRCRRIEGITRCGNRKGHAECTLPLGHVGEHIACYAYGSGDGVHNLDHWW